MIDVILAGTEPATLLPFSSDAHARLRPQRVLRTVLRDESQADVIALRLEGVEPKEGVLRDLRRRAEELRIDVLTVPAGLSIQMFDGACFDMDGTLVENECIDEMAAVMGKGEEVAAVTRAAMEGKLPFAENLQKRVDALKGFRREDMPAANRALRIMPGARAWIEFLLAHDVRVAIVTGGFTENAEDVAGRLGILEWSANRLVWDNEDRLTGEVVGPDGGRIQDAAGKKAALGRFAETWRTTVSRMIAAGDGANDMEMVAAAGFGFGYKPKAVLRAVAPNAVLFGPLSVATLAFTEAWAGAKTVD